ncbi:MAG TPA: redoxin family protein [Acidobacteriaceae bacterium]|nr:redoxin family protein [Acidobacteriaceae bacterium]
MIATLVLGTLLLQAATAQAPGQTATSGVWESSTSLQPGDTFPHFKLTPAPGTTVNSISDASLHGRRTVFVLVAALCPHCRHESTMLAGLKAQYQGKLQFVFASVSERKDTGKFVHDIGLRDCTYLGGLPVALQANVHHLPLLLLVDDQGKVTYVQHHEVDAGLEQSILGAFADGRPIPSEGTGELASPAPCSVDATSACDVTPRPKAP